MLCAFRRGAFACSLGRHLTKIGPENFYNVSKGQMHTISPTHLTVLTKNTLRLQGAPSIVCQSQRTYMRKKTVKIPPTKPLNFDYGGDLTPELPPRDPAEVKPVFDRVEELKEADETVKKLFSMEYASGGETLQKRLEEVEALVKEHPADIRSLEMKIAVWTIKIRNQMRHVYSMRKDKRAKGRLIERIQARRSKLGILKSRDIEKFDWLCKELDLVHIPIPQYNRKLSKRATLKKEAREACIDSTKAKMEEFRKKLEIEKDFFLKQKEKDMAEIRTELAELGVTEYNTLEDIFKQLKLGEPYVVKKGPRKTRRQLILEMKFKRHEERMKAEKLKEESSL